MLLQKRKQFEHHRSFRETDDGERNGKLLFESDWEVFIVKRDPETGEFVTMTEAAVDVEESAH